MQINVDQQALVGKLVDFILLNAFSIESSGLYNGKAGLSLSLFQTAKYLQDEYIESQAFELLKEALLYNGDDIGFEDGLSGIGYVLLFLIRNNYIDADFYDLFGVQNDKIITGINQFREKSIPDLGMLRMSYFLKDESSQHLPSSGAKSALVCIFNIIETYLSLQLSNLERLDNKIAKFSTIKLFEEYLAAVIYCHYEDYSRELLSTYTKLYTKGKLMSQYRIGFLISRLDIKGEFAEVSNNQRFSLNPSDAMSLRDLINFAQMHNNKDILISDKNLNVIEQHIIEHIPKGAFMAGYEEGVSRLLCYLTNPCAALL
ncbi:hypothetical protein [Hoylesella oralis]|uniref:hypothetical protein n=1 Tax=Hoylesella oralis TaxID=28134 RepID=UPI0028E81770|nr:hypothetical protein [Hoylesella oralis]